MTKIEWTNRTWNPVTGCTPCSRGCENCYALRMINRLQHNPLTADKYKEGSKVVMHISELSRPRRWRKPSMVFVCSMGDLFHENVSRGFILEIMEVIKENTNHTFQILTKRPHMFLEFMRVFHWSHLPKNLWVGTTVEDQEQADIRIPYLLKIPAHIRFISAEPLLGSINLSAFLNRQSSIVNPRLNWVIAGGETGPGSRPMHPDWVRSLRDQCQQTNTPFFFKSWGDYIHQPQISALTPIYVSIDGIRSRFRNDNHARMVRIGKFKSGNTLDGQTHTEFPTASLQHNKE